MSRAGSVAGNIVDSWMVWTDGGRSKYLSPCCSLPRISDGPAKEPKEELSVDGSDEEADDLPTESDDDLSDDSDKQVDDEVSLFWPGQLMRSPKSDEEYDDVAMQCMHEAGYWSDDEEPNSFKWAFSLNPIPLFVHKIRWLSYFITFFRKNFRKFCTRLFDGCNCD